MMKKTKKNQLIAFSLAAGLVATPLCINAATCENKKNYQITSNIYTIKKGDTLYKISKRYYGDGKYASAIAFYNGISNANIIYIGDVLRLPNINDLINYCNLHGYQNDNNYSIITYQIEHGDTLIKICDKFYRDHDSAIISLLAYYNGIKNVRFIKEGDYIQIPSLEILFGCVNNNNDYNDNCNSNLYDIYGWNYDASSDYTPNMNDNTYCIRKGNKLWGIARFYYGNGEYENALALYNGITNKRNIRVGQVIAIPPLNELLNATGQIELPVNGYVPINKYREIHGNQYTFTN